jgi:hypothetical protein
MAESKQGNFKKKEKKEENNLLKLKLIKTK